MTERQSLLPGIASLLLIGVYFGVTIARSSGWFPESWALIPVIETAWLNFLVVLAAFAWMWAQKISLAHVGLGPFKPSPAWFKWVAGTMVVDTVVVGVAMAVLTSVFGEAQQTARFEDVQGNLSLLLIILPFTWLFGAFGEEFFFRGFLLTTIAETLGGSRAAWITAVVFQAVAFGLIHAYQGPVQAISIGIGGGVYGAAFLLARRNLWPLIIAHGVNDTLGFIFLYSGAIQR